MLLANAKSRRGALLLDQAAANLRDCGLEVDACILSPNPKRLAESVVALIGEGHPYLIVGGGDGTIGAVARFFARRETVLGVLPLGTGNAFARDLRIPTSVPAACEVLAGGEVAEVDMGVIEDRSFVNVATVGLTTLIAQGLDPVAKRRLGKIAYFAALLRALTLVRPFRVTLDLDGDRQEFESLQVVVGNGRFHAGPFPVSPEASLTGGRLAVYALASRRKSDLFRMALRLQGGHHVELDRVRSFAPRAGGMTTDPVRRVTVDGEVCLRTPVRFGILPGALRVAVPVGFGEEEAAERG